MTNLATPPVLTGNSQLQKQIEQVLEEGDAVLMSGTDLDGTHRLAVRHMDGFHSLFVFRRIDGRYRSYDCPVDNEPEQAVFDYLLNELCETQEQRAM